MTPSAHVDAGYVRTRTALCRVAVHVLARRRFDVCGRFGLRASPGGFATPAFQEEGSSTISRSAGRQEWPETIRVSGLVLSHEVGDTANYTQLHGATLRDLAHFVGADVDSIFACGDDTPSLGGLNESLDLNATHAQTIADWYALGWRVLDDLIAALPAEAEPATIQLWPEHFDVGTNVGLLHGKRANLGFSPGDAYEAGPYLYIGPWGTQRPGDDPEFWNAPFGAVLRAPELFASSDPYQAGLDFFRRGIRQASTEKSG